jgi:hypothetical protein
MDTEQLFNIIGKLYADIVSAQKIIELLQQKLQEKDKEIIELTGKGKTRDN